MLVADGRARHPVAVHVGMLGVGRVNLAPAGQVRFRLLAGLLLRVLEVLQILGFLEVEVDAAVGAVQLEGVVVLAAAGIAGRFERAHRSVRELREKHAGIVDADRLDFAASRRACAL